MVITAASIYPGCRSRGFYGYALVSLDEQHDHCFVTIVYDRGQFTVDIGQFRAKLLDSQTVRLGRIARRSLAPMQRVDRRATNAAAPPSAHAIVGK